MCLEPHKMALSLKLWFIEWKNATLVEMPINMSGWDIKLETFVSY